MSSFSEKDDNFYNIFSANLLTYNATLSSAELNVGIICSCMPIVFVVFRGSTMSSPWSSFLRYFRTRGRRSGAADSKQPKDRDSGLSDDDPTLPQFQHKRSSGLHTPIHKNHHAQLFQGVTVRTEVSTYKTLASVDDTYHEQLKRTYLESYHARNPTLGTHAGSGHLRGAYVPPPPDFSVRISSHDQLHSNAHMGYPSQELYLAENYTVGRAI